MMSLRQAVRLAVFVIRHREIPAALRAQVAAENAHDDAIVDRALLHTAVELVATHADYSAAQAAAENFPLGRPRPAGQPLLSLVGSPR